MKEASYVTEVNTEEFSYPDRHVNLPYEKPPMSLSDLIEWQKRNGWRVNYSVPRADFAKAKELAASLFKAERENDITGQESTIKRLLEIRSIPWNEKTEQQKWNHMAVQKPGDWGPASFAKKEELRDIITEQCSGRVLEPMCGFRSYIGESPKISEVVAMDFSEEALKRHDHPKRKRILYNMEDVVKGDKMKFFGEGSFQTVAASFGIDYLTNTVPVHKDFYRMLSEDGKLLVVDGPAQGYMEIKKRKFNPDVCAGHMESAGFSAKVISLPTVKLPFEDEGYFMVYGVKA